MASASRAPISSSPTRVHALREPPPLRRGSRVALVSPAGPLRDATELERAKENARAMQWEPVVGAHAMERRGYLAGNDHERVRDLADALKDPHVDGIWCLRGGYGAMRLLPLIDHDLVAHAAKPLIGYSDVTALHALWYRLGLVSYHGPTARSVLPNFSHECLREAVDARGVTRLDAPEAVALRGGRAQGRLAGGNLALLAALAGTPWEVSFHGCIVVIEDVGEAPYRIDRMLTQLRLAGCFEGAAALACGHFTECRDGEDDGTHTIRELISALADSLGIPALWQVPIGHIDDQWTLPLGALATLDAEARTLDIHRDIADVPSDSGR